MKDTSSKETFIKDLSNSRYKYIKKYEKSYNNKLNEYSIKEPKEIDKLSEKILQHIKDWRDSLPLELILEELSKLGQAPCLLYDDEGHWAISSDAMQNVVCGDPINVSVTNFVEEDMWKDSIREALDHYLNVYLEEE